MKNTIKTVVCVAVCSQLFVCNSQEEKKSGGFFASLKNSYNRAKEDRNVQTKAFIDQLNSNQEELIKKYRFNSDKLPIEQRRDFRVADAVTDFQAVFSDFNKNGNPGGYLGTVFMTCDFFAAGNGKDLAIMLHIYDERAERDRFKDKRLDFVVKIYDVDMDGKIKRFIDTNFDPNDEPEAKSDRDKAEMAARRRLLNHLGSCISKLQLKKTSF